MAEAVNRPSYQPVDSKVEIMDTPYDRWIASQGIDIVRGFFVEDLIYDPAQVVGSHRRQRRVHHARRRRLYG